MGHSLEYLGLKHSVLTCVDDVLYAEIHGVPDPIVFKIRLRINNNEGFTCWYKVVADGTPPSGWTIDEQYLGSVVNGGAGTFTYSGFKRARPTSVSTELEETVNMKIEVYKDSGYTDLFCTCSFTQDFVIIDYSSAVWTENTYNNFDDGSVQGWTCPFTGCSLSVASDYYVSAPYALKMYSDQGWYESRMRKSITIGAVTKAFCVFFLRNWWEAGTPRDTQIWFDDVVKYNWPYNIVHQIWIQCCFPLPINATTQLDIGCKYVTPTGYRHYWLDEFRVITR